MTDWAGADRTELDVETGYRLWADIYDSERNALIAVEEPIVETWLNSLEFADVLDAGTGTGRHALKLAAKGARVTAIDASPEMLAIARRKAGERRLDIRFQIVRLDGRLPFDDATFDLVVCALVLDHFAGFDSVVTEFARVLRPSGHLIITDFHPDIVAAGARTAFGRDGRKYVLPNPALDTADYVEAVRQSGLALQEIVEVPMRAAPAGSVGEAFMRQFIENKLCLAILARKGH